MTRHVDQPPEQPSPWSWIEEELERLTTAKLLREPAVRSSSQDPARVQVAGKWLANFSSNDYLGLAADPRIGAAAAEAAKQGWGSGASPAITGRGASHVELERALADFEGAEDAILFPSGYTANMGAITSLLRKGDAIFSDAKNHASIIDGCRLSGAELHVYAHRDLEDLTQRLNAVQSKSSHTPSRRIAIVTDSLFSMDGCLAPMCKLTDIAEQSGAMLIVDEAHATGVFGEQGRGVCEWLGVSSLHLLKVGTLSKALGSAGGFVAGRQSVIAWLRNRARPQFFSTATPEPMAAASLAALRIVTTEPERRHDLLRKAAWLRSQLREQGWNTPDDPSQIIPVKLGTPERALQCASLLRQRLFLVPPIRPPSVPPGESLLRISVSFAHSDEVLYDFAQAMNKLRDII